MPPGRPDAKRVWHAGDEASGRRNRGIGVVEGLVADDRLCLASEASNWFDVAIAGFVGSERHLDIAGVAAPRPAPEKVRGSQEPPRLKLRA